MRLAAAIGSSTGYDVAVDLENARRSPIVRRVKPLRFLITAGPTREYVDPVRYLTNESSGTMGFALAAAAADRRHRVTLIHGPVSLPPPSNVRCVPIVSAADLLVACERHWPRCDVLIMAAAVADYTPSAPSRVKRKKRRGDLVLRLRPTVDVLQRLSLTRRAGQRVIGFALEDVSPRARAEAKLKNKQLDAIVLNTPAAIGAARSSVEVLIRGEEWRALGRRPKGDTANEIVRIAEALMKREGAAKRSASRILRPAVRRRARSNAS